MYIEGRYHDHPSLIALLFYLLSYPIARNTLRRGKRDMQFFICIKPINFQLKYNSFRKRALKQYSLNLHLCICYTVSLKRKA